jgi:hypothetical protein
MTIFVDCLTKTRLSALHPRSTFLMVNDIVDHFKAVWPFSPEGKSVPRTSGQGGFLSVLFRRESGES